MTAKSKQTHEHFKASLRGESITKIWDGTRITDRNGDRIEFPDLIRFKGHWYCAFREAEIHNNHPSGRARIIRSHDGKKWETVRFLAWDCGDVREPKFSITAEGWLMIITSVYFVSREPRMDCAMFKNKGAAGYTPPEGLKAKENAQHYQLDWLGTTLNLSDNDLEKNVAQQTMTWLSPDGVNWSGAYACHTGINTWRWDVAWHNGMGYSIAQWGKHMMGALYRTRDGKSWRLLKDAFLPKGHGGEGALAFGADGTAYCLLRGSSRTQAFIGIGKAPYYQEWEWKQPLCDYGASHGGARPITEVLRVGLGGPNLICLKDGRLIGAGRALGPGRDDGHATLFLIDPAKGLMTMLAEMDGTSYPGLAEHDGMIWVTYVGSACHRNIWEVYLAKVKIPD
ncbi:MAG: hypothetical protein WC299_08540 [Kiritimatiellia bacterium]